MFPLHKFPLLLALVIWLFRPLLSLLQLTDFFPLIVVYSTVTLARITLLIDLFSGPPHPLAEDSEEMYTQTVVLMRKW